MSAAWITQSLYCLVAPTSNTESVQVEKMKFKILRLWLVTTAECSALSIEEIRPAAVHVDHCQCSNTELCAISTRVNAIVQPGRSKSANTRVDTTLDAGRSPMLQELKHCNANSLVNACRSLKQTEHTRPQCITIHCTVHTQQHSITYRHIPFTNCTIGGKPQSG